MTLTELNKLKRLSVVELNKAINKIKLTEYEKALDDYATAHNENYCHASEVTNCDIDDDCEECVPPYVMKKRKKELEQDEKELQKVMNELLQDDI